MDIQRYIIVNEPAPLPKMVLYSEGAYVLFSDHEKVVKETVKDAISELQEITDYQKKHITALEAERQGWRDDHNADVADNNKICLKVDDLRKQIAALEETAEEAKRKQKVAEDIQHKEISLNADLRLLIAELEANQAIWKPERAEKAIEDVSAMAEEIKNFNQFMRNGNNRGCKAALTDSGNKLQQDLENLQRFEEESRKVSIEVRDSEKETGQ